MVSRLPEAGNAKVRARIEEALGSIARGLRSNRAVAAPALLAFVFSTVTDGLRLEKKAAEWAAATPGFGVALGGKALSRPGQAELSSDDEASTDEEGDEVGAMADFEIELTGGAADVAIPANAPENFHLMVAFALTLLRLHLKTSHGATPGANPAGAAEAGGAEGPAGGVGEGAGAGGGADEQPRPAGEHEGREDGPGPGLGTIAGTLEAEDAIGAAAAEEIRSGGGFEVDAEWTVPQRRALLEGLVPLLVAAVGSRHVAGADLAMRCLMSLAPLKLRALLKRGPLLTRSLMRIFRRALHACAPGGDTAVDPRRPTLSISS